MTFKIEIFIFNWNQIPILPESNRPNKNGVYAHARRCEKTRAHTTSSSERSSATNSKSGVELDLRGWGLTWGETREACSENSYADKLA